MFKYLHFSFHPLTWGLGLILDFEPEHTSISAFMGPFSILISLEKIDYNEDCEEL